MIKSEWAWAELDNEQFGMLSEAEQTLGADILLAYQLSNRAKVIDEMIDQMGIQVAPLNESQLECLQGLEQKLEAVVIAYQKE